MNPRTHEVDRDTRRPRRSRNNGYCYVEQPEPDALVGMARMAQKLYPLPRHAKDPNYAATD